MERVLVIGSPGAGKSTLATEMARRTGLPLFHLDKLFWRAGWVESDKADWMALLEALIAEPRWIIEGNYSGSLPLRLRRADTVVDLDLSAPLCVARILKRVFGSWGRVRPDMAEGCPEQLNWEFLLYTARFPGHRRKRMEEMLGGYRGAYVRLRSRREVEAFRRSL